MKKKAAKVRSDVAPQCKKCRSPLVSNRRWLACSDPDCYYHSWPQETQFDKFGFVTSPINKKSMGLYPKFEPVSRTDGQSRPGKKHHGCDYFILDRTHDPHAIPAMRAYSRSCRAEFPNLADDLDALTGTEGDIIDSLVVLEEIKHSRDSTWRTRIGTIILGTDTSKDTAESYVASVKRVLREHFGRKA